MDIIRDDVLYALHIIACERFGVKVEDGKSSVYADYENEKLCFDKNNGEIHIEVNCAADSESAAVMDFCKAIIN